MSKIPQTQRSAQISAYGGPEAISIVPDAPVPPGPLPGQVLIRNTYAGINYIDIYFRSGLYPVGSFPHILGREGEGHIAAVGDSVTGFKVGDRVAYLGESTQQEYVAVDWTRIAQIPDGLAEGIGAASLLQGLTAITFAREGYPIQKGDFVLVHAAAGGVGLWLVQIASALGAHVIATASTPEKLAIAKENGAEFTINYSTTHWPDEVLKITKGNGDGVAAVFDGVGKDTFEGDLEVLKRKGTLVSYGNASGLVPPLNINRLAPKNLRLLRPQLYPYIQTGVEFEAYSKELFDMLVEGKIKVKIHKVYPLEEVSQAHEDLASRGTTGKLILKI